MKKWNKKREKYDKLIWAAVFAVAAALSVWAVSNQASQFSMEILIAELKNANKLWLICAVLAMAGFIVFEALALKKICESLNYRTSNKVSGCYAAADIYFSAITPSATGGQPACAFLMMKNGIPGAVTTAALLFNLIMYTMAILAIGCLTFIVKPDVLMHFDTVSRILIIIGYVVQILFCILLFLMMKNGAVLLNIGKWAVHMLYRLGVIKDEQQILDKISSTISRYLECSQLFFAKKKLIFKVFLLNFLQRASQITVTFFVSLAVGNYQQAWDLWAVQSYSVIGSNCMPIPGAIGVSDYLMLSGFSVYLKECDAVVLELLSRATSFYGCIIICGLIVLCVFFNYRKKANNRKI